MDPNCPKKSVVENARRQLQTFTETLSGDDSGLGNIWDEICVQVQVEESYEWETYLEVARDALGSCLDEVEYSKQVAIWLTTDSGIAWKATEPDQNLPPVDREEVVDELLTDLLAVAADFTNNAIERFKRRSDDEESDGEEE